MIDSNTYKKLPKNIGDLGKLIVVKGFKKLPKVQKIAQPVTLIVKLQNDLQRMSSQQQHDDNKLGRFCHF